MDNTYRGFSVESVKDHVIPEVNKTIDELWAIIESQRLIIEEMRNQPTAGHRREELKFIPGQIGYGFNYGLGPLIP